MHRIPPRVHPRSARYDEAMLAIEPVLSRFGAEHARTIEGLGGYWAQVQVSARELGWPSS